MVLANAARKKKQPKGLVEEGLVASVVSGVPDARPADTAVRWADRFGAPDADGSAVNFFPDNFRK